MGIIARRSAMRVLMAAAWSRAFRVPNGALLLGALCICFVADVSTQASLATRLLVAAVGIGVILAVAVAHVMNAEERDRLKNWLKMVRVRAEGARQGNLP
jgi:hypothetical protein